MSGERHASQARPRPTILPPEPEQLRDDEVQEVEPSAGEVLQTVMGRFDAFEDRVDRRFDTFHGELSLLRGHVLGSQETRLVKQGQAVEEQTKRIEVVEKTSIAQKVGRGTAKSVAATLALSVAGIAATVMAKHWPWLQSVADAINGAP